MSASTHFVLAKVKKSGVATLIYAHPAIQEKSTVFNNMKMITHPVGSFVKIKLKKMSSGKRIILACTSLTVSSIDQFIDDVGTGILKTQAEREAVAFPKTSGSPIIPTKFDGSDDAPYIVDRYALPRVKKSSPPAAPVTANADSDLESEGDDYELFGTVYVQTIVKRALTAALKIAQSTSAVNILLTGSSGNGKTSLAKSFADRNGLSFTKVNCSVVRDPEEWFGYREAVDGTTVFVETEFTKMVKAGNAVILLDELNRLEPYLHNSLMPLLDETRSTQVHGYDITCGPQTVFIATINLGADFTGTFVMDVALKNRMDITIAMAPLTFEKELELICKRTSIPTAAGTKLLKMLTKVRDAVAEHEISVDVSHRSALKIARLYVTGDLSMKEAVSFVVFNNAESTEQSKILIDSVMGE